MNILENAILSNCDIMVRSIDPVPFTMPGNPFSGDIIQTQRVPGIQVQMPLKDWERLLSIYEIHHQSQSRHPAVRAAWEQYKITLAMTQHI